MTEPSLAEIAAEVSALRDLFARRLLEDRANARLYEDLHAQVAFGREGLARDYLRPLYAELLLLIDRLRRGGPDSIGDAVVLEVEEILARRGVRPLPAAEVFDPAVHEAVTVTADETVPRGGVVEVLRIGYLIGDDVLRPAAVVVSSGPGGGR